MKCNLCKKSLTYDIQSIITEDNKQFVLCVHCGNIIEYTFDLEGYVIAMRSLPLKITTNYKNIIQEAFFDNGYSIDIINSSKFNKVEKIEDYKPKEKLLITGIINKILYLLHKLRKE